MTVLARPQEHRRADEILFRLIYGATLPAFLLAALVARFLPARRVARPGASSGLSIVREAKAAARTCGSLALMG